MVQLPVWELGVIILIPMAIAYLARGTFEHWWLGRTPPIRQSVMQFRLEISLFLIGGIAMAFILLAIHDFPLMQSGIKLVLGIFTVGFFAALDLSLAREQTVIRTALSGKGPFVPPQRLTPLTRRFSLAATIILILITGIILLVLIRDVNWLAEQDVHTVSIAMLGRSILIEIIFVMGFLLCMVINLVFSYARNLRLLFDNETRILENVTNGDLSQRVPVATSDELGVIAGHTNTMISALREGVRMREGLLIAQEIQQHFLPSTAPTVPGLDIAGAARFSDETGGDFYDFIGCEADRCELTTIIVGDVSGHGIGAALLMAAGRALIRQSTHSPGAPSQNIADANRHLVKDLDGSGRFITLFSMLLDPVTQMAMWVNAGHQPALVYDATADRFSELKGHDIPLGVEETWQFHEHSMPFPSPSQIILIGTDGLWEAHSEAGEMFGASRVQSVLRHTAHRTSAEILSALDQAVRDFTNSSAQEDDLTMVVMKGMHSDSVRPLNP